MPFSNIKNGLHLYDESAWGTTPGTPTYVHVPHTGYGVQLRNERRTPAMYTGLRQQKGGRTFRGMPSGQLALPLFAWRPTGLTVSLAQWLLDWGFADAGGTLHETLTLPSKGAEYSEGPNIANKRHTGLRVGTTTLSGGDGGPVAVTLDLMGKDEVGGFTAQAIPADQEELTEFEFTDATFQIDNGAGGALVTLPIESFQLTVANNLVSQYVGSRRPTLIVPGARVTTFQVTPKKDDDTWDGRRRTITNAGAEPSYVAKLTLMGLHKGTGTALTNWTRVVIDLPMLKYVSHDDQRGRDEVPGLPLQFEAKKPDSLLNDVAVTWTDIA